MSSFHPLIICKKHHYCLFCLVSSIVSSGILIWIECAHTEFFIFFLPTKRTTSVVFASQNRYWTTVFEMARQNFVGLVVSQGKMNKTVKVRVQTKAYDTRVHKEVIKRKDYLVHDEGNLCKEGDIVRIESIPKISSRKYFAIAEIKVNKGQQFALYEKLAKEKVAQEEKQKITEFLQRRTEFEKTVNQIEDLKLLDRLTKTFQSNPEADRQAIIAEINQIKEKYGIASWPSSETVVSLEINEASKDLSVMENRHENIKAILDKLMSSQYTAQRERILAEVAKGNFEDMKPHTQKNLLRKYVLDPKNEVPISL